MSIGPKQALYSDVLDRVADGTVVCLLAAQRQLAERGLAEVERIVRNYFRDRQSLGCAAGQVVRKLLARDS